MPLFERRTHIPVPRDALFAYHARPGALERLIPPWQPVKILENDGPLRDGKRVVMAMKLGPLWKRWVAEHFDVVAGRGFRDRALEGPFAAWTHAHETLDDDDGDGSTLVDRVEYALPLGALGRLGEGHVRGELERMFAFRHARTANDLRQQSQFADRARLTVAVSGASGAVASNLIPFLTTAGHAVRRLVRTSSIGAGASAPRGSGRGRPGSHVGGGLAGDISWEPATGAVDREGLAACDAVVHLAGRSIATRWPAAARREIEESRVRATRGLCESLAAMPVRPRVLICASAVGYYGDRGEELLDARSGRGDGFAAGLCERWERATDPARDAGIRVVNLRIGVVLSAGSGAVAKMLTPARLGLIGPLGSGAQWMPWVAMDDLVYAIVAALHCEDVVGPVDAVAGSVRQRDFAAALGRVLRRPAVLPTPALAVRALFGQMGRELLLASAHVRPGPFAPTFATPEAALRFELGRPAA